MGKTFLDYTGLTKFSEKIENFILDKLSNFVPNTRTINNKSLSSNVELTAEDVGAPIYIGGDGVTIGDDDTINLDNPIRGIVSQEEFDALSEEEQKKGTYIIYDN